MEKWAILYIFLQNIECLLFSLPNIDCFFLFFSKYRHNNVLVKSLRIFPLFKSGSHSVFLSSHSIDILDFLILLNRHGSQRKRYQIWVKYKPTQKVVTQKTLSTQVIYLNLTLELTKKNPNKFRCKVPIELASPQYRTPDWDGRDGTGMTGITYTDIYIV